MRRYRSHGIVGLIAVALVFSIVRVTVWKAADAITTHHYAPRATYTGRP